MSLIDSDMERYVRSIFRVANPITRDRFERVPDTRLLFHGSHNQNWLNILSKGLVIRPSAANDSMFGRGLYFADKAEKSAGYTNYWRDKGYMGVFEVNLGNPLHVHTHYSWCYELPKDDRMKGYDSVWAYAGKSLRNAEYIVYRDSQATIKYLIELRD